VSDWQGRFCLADHRLSPGARCAIGLLAGGKSIARRQSGARTGRRGQSPMKLARKCGTAAAAFVSLFVIAIAPGGCDASPKARASIAQPGASQPRLIHESGRPELLELPRAGVTGLTWTTLQNVSLPGVLETTGQISFDDRRVASIISRVSGRIEQVRVSQWDYVKRGEPIV